jgi:NNP family nitrate/nitrite transporter-like MFS transporter
VPKLKESMALDPFFMGLLAACPALTGSLLRIPFGAMVDRMGGKKPILILLTLAVGGIACITLMFGLFRPPQSAHYVIFLLSGILCGCGIAVFSVGIPTVSYWYPQKKQGTALAIYAGLGNMAPGMFAIILPSLVVALGLTVSYVLWLAMLVILLGVFWFFMHDAPYFQYKQMGIKIDKDALLIVCGEELFPSGLALESVKRAGSDWRTWILTAFYFVSFGGFIALTVWFPTYWTEYFGTSLVVAGSLTALYSLSTSLLRVLGGLTSDRIGGERTVFISFLIVTIGAALLIVAAESMAVAITGEIFLALGMGFANAAVFKLVPKYTPETVGGSAGIVGGLGAFGGFVIPPVMGLFVQVWGVAGYSQGFAVFLGLSLLSLLLFAILNRYAPKSAAEAMA